MSGDLTPGGRLTPGAHFTPGPTPGPQPGAPVTPGAHLSPGPPRQVSAGAPAAPPRLGRYQIIGELGRGGMGVVYRAHDPQLARPVAIKMVLDPGRLGAAAMERLLREARAAARLRHPGIVAVHEVGQDEAGRPFLVMDLVDGEPLDRIHERDPLSPRHVAGVVREVALALDHAHREGIVHRDVKPGNILLGRDGHPRLCDLGLALEVDAASDLTRSGQLLGTPQYIAPEQARGERARVGPASDVFSLGGVLYWGLVRRPPFDGEAVFEVIRKVLSVDPVPPRRIDPRVHADLETIAMRCLEKEPDRRYGSAAEVAAELERFLAGEAIQARPLGRAQRAARWGRRNRLASAALAVAALALVGALGAVVALQVQVRRRIAEEREAMVAALRERAAGSIRAFDEARRAIDAEPDETPERRRARLERTLALGLDALGDAMALLAPDPTDSGARLRAYEVSMETGEVALLAEQWSVAASAFVRAERLGEGSDRRRASAALEQVEQSRAGLARAHHDAVIAIIERLRSGELLDQPDGREDAVWELVRYPEEQTVALLAEALSAVVDELDGVVRRTLLAAAEPTETEARAGGRTIVGLPEVVEEYVALPFGDRLGQRREALIREAADRLIRRDKANMTNEARRRALTLRGVLASVQEREVDRVRLQLARACAEALGRIGIEPVAVDALGDYLRAERDEARASVAAIALCRIGGERAADLVRRARAHFGSSSPFWRAVGRHASLITEDRVLPASASPNELIQRGQQYEEHGRPLEAIEVYDKAIALDPNNAAAWNDRGNAKMLAGDLPGALADLDRAIALAPRTARSYSNRGNVRREMGDLEGAIADHDRAVALDPSFVPALINRSNTRVDLGDEAGAVADLDRALQLEPGHTLALNNRGNRKAEAGDLDGALADVDRSIELDPGESRSWCIRGTLKHRKGQPVEAMADLDRAIELDPENADALTIRAAIKRMRGDLAGARADAARAVAAAPAGSTALADALNIRGMVHDDAGEWAEALADYDRALELDPRDAEIWNNRGNTRQRGRDYEQALADYDRAVEIDPDNVNALTNRGYVKDRLGRPEEAIADYERALAVDPRHAMAYNGRGSALIDVGRIDAAMRDFARAIELEPDDPNAWVNRGNARKQAGDLDGALADYDRAVALDPTYVLALCGRADARARRGDFEGALADADAAIEAEPGNADGWNRRGFIKQARQDVDGALADYSRAIELDPRDYNSLTNRANMRLSKKDVAGALADYDRAIEIQPRIAIIWNNRGWVKLNAGDDAGAVADLTRAIELDPRIGYAWFGRGKVRARNGDLAGARADLERFLPMAQPGSWQERETRETLGRIGR